MDQNEIQDQNTTLNLIDYARVAVVGGTLVYSVYQLGKLGVDWGRYGVKTLKNRKDQTKK